MGVDIATLGLILDGRQMRAESARVSTSLATVGKTGQTVTKTMLRLGLSIGALVAFRTATKLAGDFTTAMTRSLAIMGDVDDVMRNRLSQAARQVGIEMNLGATQAAEAFFFLASAGLDAEQSLAALVPVATFAKAGMFDMALATDLATDAQSALGLRTNNTAQDIENLTRVTDVLVKANTIANATVEQFATSITTEAGAALKIFNKDIEEGAAVLAVFADQGVKGQVAGSALSRILRIMTAAAVNNSEAYEKMNIEVFDATGNVRNFADIVEDLEGALGGLSDEQRVASLQTLGFMARIQGVINPLIGASDALRNYEDDLRSSGGITQEVAEKQLQAPMERAGAAMKVFADVGISAGMSILRVMVPALEALAANAGLVVDVLLTLAVALVALKVGALAPGFAAAAVAAFAFGSNLIFVATTAATASAALLNVAILLGPAALLVAGVAAVAAGFFLWRRSIRATREELEAQEAIIQKDTDRIKTLTDANLELAQAQAIRLLTEAQLARSAGTITEEEEIRATRFLNILRQTSREIKARADAESEAAARRAAVEAASGVEGALEFVGSAEEAAQRELERLTALNNAFGESAFVLDKINLEFDRQEQLLDIATNAELENLAALTLVTQAIFDQKLRQIELNEAREQGQLESGRERELAAIRARNDAIGQSTVEQAKLNVELARTAQLAADEDAFTGQALVAAQAHTNALFDERVRTVELTQAEAERELVADAGNQLERQRQINEATAAGGDALEKLNVELARKAALDQNAKRASGDNLVALNAATNAMFDLRAALVGANDEFDKGRELPELYAEALRQVQNAFAGGFDSITENGLEGFKDMASSIVNIFKDAATEIAAAMAADALGLDDLIQTLADGGELTRGQQIGASALAGLGFAQGGPGGGAGALQGALGGAATGFALGGPIGAGVGGVVGAIGGFFGGGDEAREAQEDFNINVQKFIQGMRDAADGFADPSIAVRNQLLDMVQGFEDAFDKTVILTEEQVAAFDRNPLLRGRFDNQTLLNANTNLEEFTKGVRDARDRFKEGSKEWNGLNEVLKASTLAVREFRRQQRELTKDFVSDLTSREAALRGDDQAALSAQLTRQQEKELQAARALVNQGTITEAQFNRLARVLDEELANAIMSVDGSVDQLLGTLMNFQDELTFGANTAVAPVQQLDVARKQFDEARRAALAGDAAAQAQLPELGRRLLEVSRQVNASGSGFQRDFSIVSATVDEVINQFGEQMTIEERGVKAQESSLQKITEALAETQETNRILREGFGQAEGSAAAQRDATGELTDEVSRGGEVLV